MLLFLTENWKIKLLALGCALILWIYVMGERRLEVGYAVPVELMNVPAGMVVTNDLPRTIDIRISGSRALLTNLNQKDIRLSVDLAGLKAGVTTFSRLDDHLRLPVGIRAARISPSFFDVKLERIVDKIVPLRVHLSGQLPGGHQLAAVEIQPERVVVQGAEGELANVNEVMTERIDLQGIKESLELNVPIDYRGKYSQIVEIKKAKVHLEIKTTTREKPPRERAGEGKL